MKRFLLRHTVLCPILAFLLIFAIFGTASVLMSRQYDHIVYHNAGETIEDLTMTQEGDNCLELVEIIPGTTETALRLRATAPGETIVDFSFRCVSEEESIPTFQFMHAVVSDTGMIFVGDKLFDYAGFPVIYYGLTLYFGLMALYFFAVRRIGRREDYYTFAAISQCAAFILFFVLFAVYVLALLVALVWGYSFSTKALVLVTRNLMLAYSILTVPFMAVFSAALAVSNVELIRHEGGRPANMLGIGTAILLALGTVLDLVLFAMDLKQTGVSASVAYAVYSAGFSILQTLLLGAVISCLQAARRKLPFGKRYIIILGCRIRKDGTLYPLLRGRVDRAIAFWQAQFEATGKRAMFVPSGGQGSDECMSEAAAMERYLVEKGIPRELILPEMKSTSTLENMRFSKELIERVDTADAVVFSTTNYHVFRSGILARQVGLKADGIGSPTKWYFWPNAMLREVVGMFAAQRKLQWLLIGAMILLAGAFGYLYTFLA